jgi:hypothetical protein
MAQVKQVDKYQYITEESKPFHSTCYMRGCNNVATTSARLTISKKLDVLIYVCDSCLPRISKNFTSEMQQIEDTQSGI